MAVTESPVATTSTAKTKSRFRFTKDHYGYLFIAPFVIGWLLFGLYPVYNTFYLSFTDTTMMSKTSEWVGLANYQRLFADDTFMTAVKNTWLLWILNFIPQIGIALITSVWFTSTRLKLRATGIWRMIYYLPNLLMPAAIAALFFSLFSFYGPVNQFMVRSGFQEEAVHYLQSPTFTRSCHLHSMVDVVWSDDHYLDGRHDLHLCVTL